jgi:hypothetical protein
MQDVSEEGHAGDEGRRDHPENEGDGGEASEKKPQGGGARQQRPPAHHGPEKPDQHKDIGGRVDHAGLELEGPVKRLIKEPDQHSRLDLECQRNVVARIGDLERAQERVPDGRADKGEDATGRHERQQQAELLAHRPAARE